MYHDKKSIHLTEIKPLEFDFSNEVKNGNSLVDIISYVRGEKSNNNVSLKTVVKELNISCSAEIKDAIEKSIKDFKATLFIENLKLREVKKDYKITKVELEIEKDVSK